MSMNTGLCDLPCSLSVIIKLIQESHGFQRLCRTEDAVTQDAHLDCVGCDIVQSDHAPEAGVAQGIFHGDLVRHQGRHQEEVEEGLEEEVEIRVKRENTQATKHKCACMDDME